MSGFAAEEATVRGHLEANWNQTPIAWDNVDYAPTPGQAWIRPDLLTSDVFAASIAEHIRWRHVGRLVIGIFVPKGSGPGFARRLADDLAALFRGLNLGGIRFGGPTFEPVGVEGDWYHANLDVPLQRDATF